MFDKENSINAEILSTLNVMMKHFSFRSCMDWDKLFKSMFPDRKIARQFKRSKTKCSYYINFGIAPVFNKNLTKEISIPLCWNRTHSDLTCFFHQININLKTKKKIKKSDFYKNKKVFKIDEIDADKILVSKIEPYGTNKSIKYFIGYNDDDVIRPLCMKLPQMIGYV